MRLPISPLVGVGPIQFVMNRIESRQVIASPLKSFRRTPDGNLIDSYFEACLQISFNDQDTVEFIEIAGGGEISPVLMDQTILSLNADDTLATLSAIAPYDLSMSEVPYSFVFPTLELALWRPVTPKGTEPSNDPYSSGIYFSTVGIGRLGYYSKG